MNEHIQKEIDKTRVYLFSLEKNAIKIEKALSLINSCNNIIFGHVDTGHFPIDVYINIVIKKDIKTEITKIFRAIRPLGFRNDKPYYTSYSGEGLVFTAIGGSVKIMIHALIVNTSCKLVKVGEEIKNIYEIRCEGLEGQDGQ